jgi:hypothetical protein
MKKKIGRKSRESATGFQETAGLCNALSGKKLGCKEMYLSVRGAISGVCNDEVTDGK